MNSKKKSPGGSKQSKITEFCRKGPVNQSENDENICRKRKNNEEVCQFSPPSKKKALFVNCNSPDVFVTSPEGKDFPVNDNENVPNFHDFPFEDFENDPFLSPKKERSPKKNVLTENFSSSSGDENWQEEKSELSFQSVVKCKVLETRILTKGRFEQILIVKDEILYKRGVCKLRDVWASSPISKDDVLSIQAIESEEGWLVDNKNGFVILYPDQIISSTSLVGSMFCMRQGILSNFYKGIDISGNYKMLIGRLIHELFQECLKIGSCSEKNFSEIVGGFLKSHDYLREIYFSNLKESQIKKEIEDFLPQIKNFFDVYLNKTKPACGKNFKGTIEKIVDIEELIRSPNLGIQGRIDVTVRRKLGNSETEAPLELKTGRASFSNEHRSQLILYTLLLNELGRKVESGLLLYLKENIMEEIIPQRDEIRNLYLLRNQFVKNYKGIKNDELPDPIRNVKACSKCSYLQICTIYMKAIEKDKFSEIHPLKNIEVPEIKDSHVDYFVKWNKMLWLEYGEIFEEVPDNLETSNLKLNSRVETFGDEFKHNFVKTTGSKGKALCRGTYVHVQNQKGSQICTGRIVEDTDSFLSVLTNIKLENLSEMYKVVVFQFKFLNFYMSNLGLFLNERFENLRNIIVDKKPPTFRKNLNRNEFKEKCLKFLVNLNKTQQKAVLKALLCDDYLLIKGPPGTGKTQTIVALIGVLVALGKRVLISGHTHSSVDNILLRLKDIDFLRLGSLKSIKKQIHPKCYATLVENCSSVDDMKNIFDRKVIASTCSGIDFDLIYKGNFDYCIVDESSQVLQPEILRPLFCTEKFILVGDDDQLPPIVHNLEAKKIGMDVSVFERLTKHSATVCLKFQYRMNSVINALANSIAYNGLIECANDEVANGTMKVLSTNVNLRDNDWMTEVLSCELEKSVVFVDTSDCFKSSVFYSPEQPRSSVLEANIILKLIKILLLFGISEKNIGVIAPFCDQIELIKKKFNEAKIEKIELNTVDQYQGRDKEVILFSCGKENLGKKEVSESELLNDNRRLTVAVTRAKHKLIFIGDRETVIRYHSFQKLIKSLKDSQIVCLNNGKYNFFWKDFLN